MARAQHHATGHAPTGVVGLIGDGVQAGLYGAATVAMWFFAVDAVLHEPLYTPSLVGSAVLSGAVVAPEAAISLGAVALYTVVHSALFGIFGIAYAWVLSRLAQTPDFPLIAISVFVPLELGFVAGSESLVPGLAEVLGHGYIAAGNVLAAIAMALYLRFGQPHRDDAS